MSKVKKAVILFQPDGTKHVFSAPPAWSSIREIINGPIEFVNVLDYVGRDGVYRFTIMLVDEEGLIKDRPRNQQATEVYQRNARMRFPHEDNPFKAMSDLAIARWSNLGATVLVPSTDKEFDKDPYIAGPAIYYQGYSPREVRALFGDDE